MALPKYIKGETPCKLCRFGNHSRCKKREYCSCNCPNIHIPIKHSNQNTIKTHCIRGHEFTMQNTYMAYGKHRYCRTCWKIRRENNREKSREVARRCYQKHKNEYRLLRRIAAKSYLKRVKLTVLTHYGNNNLGCICCGESEPKFLTIDHIVQIGRKNKTERGRTGHNMYRYLIKNHFPEGFQTLCFNCNSGRAINGGICPHKMVNKNKPEDHIKTKPIVNLTKEGDGQ